MRSILQTRNAHRAAIWPKNIRRFTIIRRFTVPALLGLYLLCAVPWVIGRVYLEITIIRGFPKTYNSLVLKELARLRPFTEFLYTDEPIYSFHSGIPMPPQHAVVALKRFWSGDMTNARIASDLGGAEAGCHPAAE